MSDVRARRLGGGACELGEGVIWDPRTGGLAWVDILAGRILRAVLGPEGLGPVEEARFDVPVGAIAPHAGGDGWIAAAGDGIALVEDGRLEWLARPEADAGGATRMNDAACDPTGAFWAGSMAYDSTPGAGSLYRVDASGACRRMLDRLTVSNGLGWSPDGATMYLADSGAARIEAFECDLAAGTLGARWTVADFAGTGHAADGLCVDAEGTLWTALWDGEAVLGLSPEGDRVARVAVGARRPTSCALEPGGSRMVISSAFHGLEAPGAGAGELWLAEVSAVGQPQPCWPS